MATYTRPIPTLRGEDAKIFNKKADEALKKQEECHCFWWTYNRNEENSKKSQYDVILWGSYPITVLLSPSLKQY